jgi:hypothetical protein
MPASQPSETVPRTVQVRVAWAVALVTVALVALGVALLPAQEWRLVVWAAVVATVAVVVSSALTPGPVEYYPQFQNPLGLAGLARRSTSSSRSGSWCSPRACSRPRGR